MKHHLDVKQLNEHTWMLSEGSGRGRTHCYLLEGTHQSILIDTGCYMTNMKSVADGLTNNKVSVVNTHGHLDHITNNHQFDQVYLHREDEMLAQEHRSAAYRRMFIKERFIKHGMTQNESWSYELQEELNTQAVLPLQTAFTYIEHGTVLELGERSLRVVATPGHTKGSICILDEKYRSLYTGDTICEDGVLLQLPHSTTVEAYLHSLYRLKEESHLFDSLYGGHQRVPLPLSVLDAYIDCAKEIMQVQVSFMEKQAQRYQRGRAAITFLPTQIKEEL